MNTQTQDQDKTLETEPSEKHVHVHGPNCSHSHHHALSPVIRQTPKVGRNDDCPCGSKNKFKKCCGK